MNEELIKKSRKELLDKMMVIRGANPKDVTEFIRNLNSIEGINITKLKDKELDEDLRFIINLLHSTNLMLWSAIIIHFLNKKRDESKKPIFINYKKIEITQGDSEEVIEEKVKTIFEKKTKEEEMKN